MSKLRRSLRIKLRSAFSKLGCRSSSRGKDGINVGGNNSLSGKLSVNEEYKGVFRTNSYVEMWDKVHQHQPSTGSSTRTSLQSSSSSIIPNMDRSECLLEPQQETLKDIIHEEGLNLHQLLKDYFEASLDACHVCDLLLRGIHQTRLEYRKMKKLILKLSQRLLLLEQDHHTNNITSSASASTSPEEDEQCTDIFGELTRFSGDKNPLSIIGPLQFREIHDGYLSLFNRLTSKRKKVRRNRMYKKVGAVGLVVSHSAVLIALLVFAIHSIVGIVVAPALMACLLGFSAKQMASVAERRRCTSTRDRSRGKQLDVAAKGVFTLVNDFDTMSRMVRRLHDQVEDRKDVAHVCVNTVRSGTSFGSSCDIFVRKIHATESNFLDQLEELEEHIYLCLLTINRSRRLVLEQILATE